MVEEGREADTDRGEVDEAGGDPAGLTSANAAAPAFLFDLVDFLARNLVLHPEAVEVRHNSSEQAVPRPGIRNRCQRPHHPPPSRSVTSRGPTVWPAPSSCTAIHP